MALKKGTRMAQDRGVDAFKPTKRANSQGIIAQIVREMQSGLTVAQCAAVHHVPVDFIEMTIERARATGQLEVIALDACGRGTCAPDPNSLVCAGCPFRK